MNQITIPNENEPKRVLCIAADGFEDLELVAAVDVLTRVGVRVVLAALGNGTSTQLVQGAYGMKVQADTTLSEITKGGIEEVVSAFDGVFVPGGKKNAIELSENASVLDIFKAFAKANKMVAAICAAPSHVLVGAGLAQGKKVSGDPFFNEKLAAGGGLLTGQPVTVDGNLITGTGPGTALSFGLAMAEYQVGQEPLAAFRQKWGIPLDY